jgi:hypothetical protein
MAGRSGEIGGRWGEIGDSPRTARVWQLPGRRRRYDGVRGLSPNSWLALRPLKRGELSNIVDEANEL